ncbi:hypothetical protein CONPUDRAFT_73177 [Coniophora puteana RWD-64-598 SS2]|uniref:Uncharacterized protein n=1 Tax=Coniophora puteana (strain RWD-64-598) TaxID=741705 RepID=A0A5M3MQG5_CONPW|nr:uncharacterized protein CONPUDRAFT_73177 [Coniophora puteana RWD-64-598 SS2]EIW81448.1 hypothetical protein CONPUDRAFT_73177 [Coniophora puteana RWD-64-598 SS2]
MGRPKKYHTDEELKAARRQCKADYYARNREGIKAKAKQKRQNQRPRSRTNNHHTSSKDLNIEGSASAMSDPRALAEKLYEQELSDSLNEYALLFEFITPVINLSRSSLEAGAHSRSWINTSPDNCSDPCAGITMLLTAAEQLSKPSSASIGGNMNVSRSVSPGASRVRISDTSSSIRVGEITPGLDRPAEPVHSPVIGVNVLQRPRHLVSAWADRIRANLLSLFNGNISVCMQKLCHDFITADSEADGRVALDKVFDIHTRIAGVLDEARELRYYVEQAKRVSIAERKVQEWVIEQITDMNRAVEEVMAPTPDPNARN